MIDNQADQHDRALDHLRQAQVFTKKEDDALLLRSTEHCEHPPTTEQVVNFLEWARKTEVSAMLLNGIRRGTFWITSHKDDGEFVLKAPKED